MSTFIMPKPDFLSVDQWKKKERKSKKKSTHKCQWVQTWYSGGSKWVYKCSVCSNTRNVSFSKKEEKSIREGDMLQPVGKDKDLFARKYGYLPGESKEDVERFLKRYK